MTQYDFDVSLTQIYALQLAWILITHFGVICPTGSHLTTCFSLGFELQRRGHRITFLNVLDVQDKVLAANFRFRAIGETEFPVGSQVRLAERRGKLSGMAALKDTLKVVEQGMWVILQQAPPRMTKARAMLATAKARGFQSQCVSQSQVDCQLWLDMANSAQAKSVGEPG